MTLSLEVRDLNHLSPAPAEMLVKIYDPEGRVQVREMISDDGVCAPSYAPALAGWDHEAWYYQTCRTRGLEPMISWSQLTEPSRLSAIAPRRRTWSLPGGRPGVSRLLLLGVPDHVVTLTLQPDRPVGVASSQTWLHGQGSMFAHAWLYVPAGTKKVDVLLLEMDRPATRTVRVFDPLGRPLPLKPIQKLEGIERPGALLPAGFFWAEGYFPAPGAYDGQVLKLEVTDGDHAYLLGVAFALRGELPLKRLNHTANAILAPDADTAQALRGGTLPHDGQQFWHGFQVRYHEFLKTLPPAVPLPPGLPVRPGYVSPGSHQSPGPDSADRLMHSYSAHRNPGVLCAALREMAHGLNAIGPGDHVLHGPLKNLAYEMGCYGYFYHRPAWRILQASDAPEAAKEAIREFIVMMGDRLAFCRGGELVNGNALASLVQALRYCVEASQDPLQKTLFETYWERFAGGGFGSRVGIGPSGAIQESFGYDHNYGSYVVRGWRAVVSDLGDPRFQTVLDRIQTLYSYTHSMEVQAAPWSSRTHGGIAGGTYSPTNPVCLWKGFPGPDFTVDVNGGHEFFAARRQTYYALTYHGRLSPSWIGEGFHGQIGYGGGMLCQLHVPGCGPVIASTLHGSYGQGMHPSQWRGFHIHSLVGVLPDGRPFVSAHSEHEDAHLEGNVVTSSGEVRHTSIRVFRRYVFEADRIVCETRLAPADGEGLFALYGGKPEWRGRVAELWEMIPWVSAPASARRGRSPPTRVWVLPAAGGSPRELDESLMEATEVDINRGNFGCRLRLTKPTPIRRGERDTVLIQVVSTPTHAAAVALRYELIPYTEGPAGRGAFPADPEPRE